VNVDAYSAEGVQSFDLSDEPAVSASGVVIILTIESPNRNPNPEPNVFQGPLYCVKRSI